MLTKQREASATTKVLALQHPATLLRSHGHSGDTGAATRTALGRAEKMLLAGGSCSLLLALADSPDTKGFS